MQPLLTGARLLSKGIRRSNGALTLLGAFLVARGIMRWLDAPTEELIYSRRIRAGEHVTVSVERPDA